MTSNLFLIGTTDPKAGTCFTARIVGCLAARKNVLHESRNYCNKRELRNKTDSSVTQFARYPEHNSPQQDP